MLPMFLLLAVLVLFIALYLAFDHQRYQGKCDGSKTRPTSEVFRDPESGRVIRVHEDPETGGREYRLEDEK